MKKRVLIISEYPLVKTFILATIRRLKLEGNITFDCFIVTKLPEEDIQNLRNDFVNVFINNYPKGFVSRIPKFRFFQYLYGLRKLARQVPVYDFIHVHFHHYYYISFIPILRKKAGKNYISFFGSDFNQLEWYKHFCNQLNAKKANGIFTTSNPVLLSSIKKRYNVKNTISTDVLIPLIESFQGFSDLQRIVTKESAALAIDLEGPIITCGYNAASIVRHTEIIKALRIVKSQLKEFTVVFPMTYGQNAKRNVEKVKSELKNIGLKYRILEEYLPFERIQLLCIATDVFIHIQKRDQMAASMLEQLASGSVMITGKWLPYDMLIEKGVFFIQIDELDDLPEAINDVVTNLHAYKAKAYKNRGIILNLMNWETIKENWFKYYELEPER